MKRLKENKAITLVALVITIIILLILAGITISQLTENGLFENSKLAKQKYDNAKEKEDDILKEYMNVLNGNYTLEATRNIPEGYLKPEGTFNINQNGEYDITNYKKVNVNVNSGTLDSYKMKKMIPTMTSNTTPSGTVNASSVYSGREAWWGFADTVPDITTGTGYWFASANNDNPWLTYTWNEEIFIGYISFYKNEMFDLKVQYLSNNNWIDIKTFSIESANDVAVKKEIYLENLIKTNSIRFISTTDGMVGYVNVIGLEN